LVVAALGRSRDDTLRKWSCRDTTPALARHLKREEEVAVFLFFSNRLGCLGSLAVSILATLVLISIVRML
jgi:hypothetical protein